MGKNWLDRFRTRHPELSLKNTTPLEESRARALTPAAVSGFYDLLDRTVSEHHIPPENIYNMDEKGIQLGIGARTAVLVDRSQKSVASIEPGNRDLVTIIETVCADGTALHPSVIFEARRRDARWGEENPANASILISPNGWTDQELGFLWLMKDFEPISASRNVTNGYRLLILDGHNSHCTYRFCKYAEEHRIIVICLPAHTTHALQPCDVGVFGPLASSWKAHVSFLSRQYIIIDKYNLLKHYAIAREKAFKVTTVSAAFRKTGIHPFNRHAIDSLMFEPAKNFTTQAAMPVPAQVPSLLVPMNPSVPRNETILKHRSEQLYQIALPPPAPHTRRSVSHNYLEQENKLMREQLESAGKLLDANFAHMRLMEAENARLRNKVFAKKRTKKRIAVNSGTSRHLTGEENMHELLKYEMKQVLEGLKSKFRTIRKEIKKAEQAEAHAKKVAEKVRKAAEKALQKEAKAAQQRALGRGRGRTRGHVGRRSRGGARRTRGNVVGRGRGSGVQQEDKDDTETEGSESESRLSLSDDNTLDEDSTSKINLPNPIHGLSNPSPQPSSPYPVHPRPKPRPLMNHQVYVTPVVEADNSTGSSGDDSEFLEGEGGEGSVGRASIEDTEALEEETKIRCIIGHKWIGRGLRFLVDWDDGDITWEPFSNVQNCVAVDVYLEHHAVADHSELPRKMYRIE